MPSKPSIFGPACLFTVTPEIIAAGEKATLEWQVQGAVTIYLDGEAVAPQGTKIISPTATATSTLQMVYADNTMQTATVQLTVNPAPVRELLIGLAIPAGPRDTLLPSAAELNALGTRWVRHFLTAGGQDYETGQNTGLDLLSERYCDLDVQFLVVLNQDTLGENPPDSNSDQWGDADSGYTGHVAGLAQKLAAFYKDQIGAIEVFNEPDALNITPERYAELLAACYAQIKAVSQIPVISAGICCGQNHPYLRALVQNAPDAFDGVGWHPFGLAVDGYPASIWGNGDLRDSLILARRIGGKPLWLTQVGAALDYEWPAGNTPAQATAEYLQRAFSLFRALGPDTVTAAFWYTWQEPTGGWGLVDPAGIRRPTWYALQQQTTASQPIITQMSMTPVTVDLGQLLNITITVKNNSADTLVTQGPEPGFVYEEGDSYSARGFAPIAGALRVGIDFDERVGVDHPYRWGLGASLAPGETATIVGSIRVKTPKRQNYWAGLIQEQGGWVQDRQGVQSVTVRPALLITNVTITPATLQVGELLQLSITVLNNGTGMISTQGPEPGFVYEEGDTFALCGFKEEYGQYRVGIDFDGNSGIGHPYRWGLGAPLAPGESRVVTGAIRMTSPQAQNYWVGLVREGVAWLQDKDGAQAVTVQGIPRLEPPQILAVVFSPTTLAPNELLNVSITVKNNSSFALATQGPEPGTVYDEGDSFYTHGFPAIPGAFRVGVDLDWAGIDHPYRWGFGAPLAPGETRVITGSIRLAHTQSKLYWAGLVQELVEWVQDRQGIQKIMVLPASLP